MNAQLISQIAHRLQKGDKVIVTRKINGRPVDFTWIIEDTHKLSTGLQVNFIGGITPEIGGPAYRDSVRDINPYRDINVELNIWALRVESHNNEIPEWKEDYINATPFHSRYPNLKGNPGYDLMM